MRACQGRVVTANSSGAVQQAAERGGDSKPSAESITKSILAADRHGVGGLCCKKKRKEKRIQRSQLNPETSPFSMQWPMRRPAAAGNRGREPSTQSTSLCATEAARCRLHRRRTYGSRLRAGCIRCGNTSASASSRVEVELLRLWGA